MLFTSHHPEIPIRSQSNPSIYSTTVRKPFQVDFFYIFLTSQIEETCQTWYPSFWKEIKWKTSGYHVLKRSSWNWGYLKDELNILTNQEKLWKLTEKLWQTLMDQNPLDPDSCTIMYSLLRQPWTRMSENSQVWTTARWAWSPVHIEILRCLDIKI